MHLKTVRRVFLASLIAAVLGAGCAQNTPTDAGKQAEPTVSGPKPLVLDGLSPKDATKKIVPTSSSVFIVKQRFVGPGIPFANSIGYGASAQRAVVIKRFAPANLAEVEWKIETILPVKDEKTGAMRDETRQYVGTVRGGNLRNSHELFPPAYWKENQESSFDSGILWLSQDVYEDLAMIRNSTLKFGVENGNMLEYASPGSALRSAVANLQKEITKIIDRKDVFLTTADFEEQDIMVNGAKVRVEVIKAKNWFGEITVLKNSQNPLVLKLVMGKPGGVDFGGLFDYEITELRDITE